MRPILSQYDVDDGVRFIIIFFYAVTAPVIICFMAFIPASDTDENFLFHFLL